MFRFSMISALTAAIAIGVGCDEGNEREVANAHEEVREAKKEAAHGVADAKAEGAEAVAEAQGELIEARAEYQKEMTEKLATLDGRIARVEADAKTATGDEKVKLDARLGDIRTRRTAWDTSWRSADGVAGDKWAKTKARLDREWQELEASVDGK